MSAAQQTWVPLPKRSKARADKLNPSIESANRLIDWYRENKPSVKRLAVTPGQYKAFEQAVGTNGIHLTAEGVMYRGFVLYAI